MEKWKHFIRRLKLDFIKDSAPSFFEISGGYAMKVGPYSDTTANGLTLAIEVFLNYIGEGEASRINSTGMPRTINGEVRWTKGNTRKGLADIRGTYKGRSLSIEIKIGDDQQSEAQVREMERIRNAGGIYIIAKSFPQFLSEFIKIFPDVLEKIRALGFNPYLLTHHDKN